MSAISIKKLNKFYDSNHVIRDASIEIESNSFTVLVGPSGCGKSTILRMIAGLEEVDSGTISIDGNIVNSLHPKERGIAMVFQSYALYPHMTVFDNIGFGLRLEGQSKHEIEAGVSEAARILKIEDLLDRKPRQLSGGQRQRVAIGRAITRKPKVFLFDEPLSNLDAALRVQMRVELAKLHDQLTATMLYVTHDQTEAMTMADRIVVLDKGEVSQAGAPLELYNSPKNSFVASFIGSPTMNFLKARAVAVTKGSVTIKLLDDLELKIANGDTAVSVGDELTLGVRPENLLLVQTPKAHCTGKVSVVEQLGSQTFLYLETVDGPLILEADGSTKIKVGDLAPISFDVKRCHLFNKHHQKI